MQPKKLKPCNPESLQSFGVNWDCLGWDGLEFIGEPDLWLFTHNYKKCDRKS